MFVWLTQSWLRFGLFFLLGCYIVFQRSIFLSRLRKLFCHLAFLICECKSINYFLINKTFFDIFFQDRQSHYLLC
jgi:hypothetical protein